MPSHRIVELEEGALGLAVVAGDGESLRLVRSKRLPLPDAGRDALPTALRALVGEDFEVGDGVHVLLGDRRMQHFVHTLPALSPADAVAFVVREGLRLTGADSPADLLLSLRLLRVLPDGRLQLAATAIARSVVEPLLQAFAAAELPVAGLYSLETCLSLAAPSAAGEHTAVVECNGARARFVLASEAAPLQVRRFVVGGGDGGAAATQLAMELPRTFDWLRESGHGTPQRLVLGHRVVLDDATLSMLRADQLPPLERALPLPTTAAAAAQAPVGLGTTALARALAARTAPPSLLERPVLRLPWDRRRKLTAAAALLLGAFATVHGGIAASGFLGARAERQRIAAERAELERQLLGEPEPAAAPAGESQLSTALGLRRPISRTVAEISNRAVGLDLDELRFTANEPLQVSGVVDAGNRKQALDALWGFTQSLREIPWLAPSGQEEISELEGGRSRLRFRIGLTWRKP